MDLLSRLRLLRRQPALRLPVLVLLLQPGGLLPLRNAVQHWLADGSSQLKPLIFGATNHVALHVPESAIDIGLGTNDQHGTMALTVLYLISLRS